MSTLSEMAYKDFGKLRFLDFFPKTEQYVEDHEGGLESGIGLASYEGYRIFTCFASPVDSRWETSEITLDFENGCPETHANALMQHLGLPTRKGWTRSQIKVALGHAQEDDPTYLRYILGTKWQYYVDFYIKENEGMFKAWNCRKDLADRQIESES